MSTCNFFSNMHVRKKMHVDINFLHVNMRKLHVNMKKINVNMHFFRTCMFGKKSHVNMQKFHVNMHFFPNMHVGKKSHVNMQHLFLMDAHNSCLPGSHTRLVATPHSSCFQRPPSGHPRTCILVPAQDSCRLQPVCTNADAFRPYAPVLSGVQT
jgi:hypothetical protein